MTTDSSTPTVMPFPGGGSALELAARLVRDVASRMPEICAACHEPVADHFDAQRRMVGCLEVLRRRARREDQQIESLAAVVAQLLPAGRSRAGVHLEDLGEARQLELRGAVAAMLARLDAVREPVARARARDGAADLYAELVFGRAPLSDDQKKRAWLIADRVIAIYTLALEGVIGRRSLAESTALVAEGGAQ